MKGGCYTIINFIKSLIDLEDVDDNIIITDFRIENHCKIISVEYKCIDVYCSSCGSKMHVKDKYIRNIKHCILQDGFSFYIEYHQRSWSCKVCKARFTPEVPFVEKYKQHSNINSFLAINKLSDLTRSVKSVSNDFYISDTHLHNLFLQHVDMKRLPLPEVISIDEVYTNFREDCKYSLVIMDFFTHDIIDILPSRREEYTKKYFLSIPIKERRNIKYIISDMYEPYLNYMYKYFPNAQTAIDSFHVISWLINRISVFLRKLARKYENDKKSDEYYLLKHKQWIMLMNEDNIKDIEIPKKIDSHFHCFMTTNSYREHFFKIDHQLEMIHELKEMYIEFNNKDWIDNSSIKEELNKLIHIYQMSNIDIFLEFSEVLQKKQKEIINSFIVMPSLGKTVRLSNGAMESFNRKPKDLKRLARGIENFEFFRQRILFSERSEKTILGTPKKLTEIQNKTNKKRKKYNKNK